MYHDKKNYSVNIFNGAFWHGVSGWMIFYCVEFSFYHYLSHCLMENGAFSFYAWISFCFSFLLHFHHLSHHFQIWNDFFCAFYSYFRFYSFVSYAGVPHRRRHLLVFPTSYGKHHVHITHTPTLALSFKSCQIFYEFLSLKFMEQLYSEISNHISHEKL